MHFVSTFSLSAAWFFHFLIGQPTGLQELLPGNFQGTTILLCPHHAPLSEMTLNASATGTGTSLWVTTIFTQYSASYSSWLISLKLRIMPCGVFCYFLSLRMCWSIIIKDALLWSCHSFKSSIGCCLASWFPLSSPEGGARECWERGERQNLGPLVYLCTYTCCDICFGVPGFQAQELVPGHGFFLTRAGCVNLSGTT